MSKRILLSLFLVIMILCGCKADGDDSSDLINSVSYNRYDNVKDDITITVKTDPITTQTQEIDLAFTNNTNRELIYQDTSIILEKKVNDGFVFVGNYGTGHEIATGLDAYDTNYKSVSIEPLETGTYRFVFLQGYSTPEGPVYISSEFQVTE